MYILRRTLIVALTVLAGGSTIGLFSSQVGAATMVSSEEIAIPFNEAISGLPFFNFDSDDLDSQPDATFSTVDPEGFNTSGPGSNQFFIDEPGLEGGQSVNETFGTSADLRVDFLRGAVGSVSFGFATTSLGNTATVSLFDTAGNSLTSASADSSFRDLETGEPVSDPFDDGGFGADDDAVEIGMNPVSGFPEGIAEASFDGQAAFGLIDFSSAEGDRYIIDNFTFTPASDEILNQFEGVLPDEPVLPGEITEGEQGQPVFNFDDLEIVEGGLGTAFPIFIDPDISTGYTYEVVSGPKFATVTAPSTLPNGDGSFTLALPGGQTITILANQTIDLTALVSGGLDRFQITDISVDEMLDPTDPTAFVTGLTFVSGGTANVTQSPIVQTVSVPLPHTLGLLLSGVLGLSILGRRWGHQMHLPR